MHVFPDVKVWCLGDLKGHVDLDSVGKLSTFDQVCTAEMLFMWQLHHAGCGLHHSLLLGQRCQSLSDIKTNAIKGHASASSNWVFKQCCRRSPLWVTFICSSLISMSWVSTLRPAPEVQQKYKEMFGTAAFILFILAPESDE